MNLSDVICLVSTVKPLSKDTWLIRTLDRVPTIYYSFPEIKTRH